MKLKHTLSLLSLATCAALSSSAFAQQTVTFTGKIVNSACGSVVANNGADVVLPQRSVTDFGSNVGNGTGDTPFSVVLDQCQPLPGTFAINFSEASVDPGTGYLVNTGVTNVGYELLTGMNGTHIHFTKVAKQSNDPFDANTPTTGNVTTAGPHTLNYAVRYVRLNTAALGTGATNATATMTVQYN